MSKVRALPPFLPLLLSLDRVLTLSRPTPAEIDEQTDRLNKDVADAEKEREKLQGQQADDQRGIARQQKSVERYLAKRQVLQQRKDECNKNIRDLGVLPEEAFNENKASSEKVRLALSRRRRRRRPRDER